MSGQARSESLATRWKRRAISVPAVVLASVLFAALCLPAVVIALIGDVVQRLRRRPSAYTRGVLAVGAVLLAEVVGLFAMTLLWVLLLGRAAPVLRATFVVQVAWASFLFWSLRHIYNLSLHVDGADVVSAGPFVVFARHTSIFDTLVPIVTIAAPHGIMLRYVMKRELLWDPCLDVAGQRLPNRFVARGSSDPARQIALVAELGESLGPRDGVVIYPEGTRYTAKKHAEAIEKLERTNPALAELGRKMKAVLPPRPGGPLALLAYRHDVVFMAHSGFDGITGWRDVWYGGLVGRAVRVRFTRYAASDVPEQADARARWLFERWKELDDWVRDLSANASLR